MMDNKKPHKVDNFYTSCYNCKVWINYTKGRNEKKWTRNVYDDYMGVDQTLLYDYTKEFSKKELKALTTGKKGAEMIPKRDDYLDGNTQADFDKVNTANADMQMEISELRTRLARLIKGVRRAQKGKVSVSDLKL
jgi:hypothetical protein